MPYSIKRRLFIHSRILAASSLLLLLAVNPVLAGDLAELAFNSQAEQSDESEEGDPYKTVMLFDEPGEIPPDETILNHDETLLNEDQGTEQLAQGDPAVTNSLTPVRTPYGVYADDRSNTNPVLFRKTAILLNEFRDLEGNDSYANFTVFKTFLPFAHQKAMFRVDVPMVYARASDNHDEFGLGDVLTRLNYVPFDNERVAVLLGVEHYWPTATDELLQTTGKFTVGPLAGVIFFLKKDKTVIFGPVYEHLVSYAGNENRPDFHQGRVDLYTAWRTPDFKCWVLLEQTIYINYENGQGISSTIELEIGRVIGKGTSVYVRPGVGIGDSRLYNVNLEVGLQYVR